MCRNERRRATAQRIRKPTELFLEVGDAVDPSDRITTADFYLAQLALFEGQRRRGKGTRIAGAIQPRQPATGISNNTEVEK